MKELSLIIQRNALIDLIVDTYIQYLYNIKIYWIVFSASVILEKTHEVLCHRWSLKDMYGITFNHTDNPF